MDIPRPNRPRRGIFTLAFIGAALAIVVQLCLLAAVIYVAHHFIVKFW